MLERKFFMVHFDTELVDAQDYYEDELIVLTKYFFKSKCFDIERICACVKDESGDIVRIVNLTERYLLDDERLQ